MLGLRDLLKAPEDARDPEVSLAKNFRAKCLGILLMTTSLSGANNTPDFPSVQIDHDAIVATSGPTMSKNDHKERVPTKEHVNRGGRQKKRRKENGEGNGQGNGEIQLN